MWQSLLSAKASIAMYVSLRHHSDSKVRSESPCGQSAWHVGGLGGGGEGGGRGEGAPGGAFGGGVDGGGGGSGDGDGGGEGGMQARSGSRT